MLKKSVSLFLVFLMVASFWMNAFAVVSPIVEIPIMDGLVQRGTVKVTDTGSQFVVAFDFTAATVDGYTVSNQKLSVGTNEVTADGTYLYATFGVSAGSSFTFTASANFSKTTTGLTQTILSDGNTKVVGRKNNKTIIETGLNVLATPAWEHSAWAIPAANTLKATGADFIWYSSTQAVSPQTDAYYIDDSVKVTGEIVEFERSFAVNGVITSAILDILCDNGFVVVLNGTNIGQSDTLTGSWSTSDLTEAQGVAGSGWNKSYQYNLLGKVAENNLNNRLQITGVNEHQPNGTQTSNPGGLIYVLQIGYNATETKTLTGSMPYQIPPIETPPTTTPPSETTPPVQTPPPVVQVPLTVIVEGPGTATPGTGSYGLNSVVQFSVTPAEGAIFVGWFGENGTDVVDNRITMTAAKTVIARFELPAPVVVDEEDVPEAVDPVVEDTDAGETEIVIDIAVPQAAPELPKTAGLPIEMMLAAGTLLSACGYILKKRN